MKLKKAFMWAVFLVVSVFLYDVSADDPCSGVDNGFIRKHASVADFTIVSSRPVSGLCEVIINYRDQLVPLYAGKNFIISGNLYKDRVKITDESINSIKAGNFNKHLRRIKEAVSFSYIPEQKTGKSVYMFTDPLCGFCNRAIKSVKTLADKHGAVFNFIIISYHGKKGKAKAVEAVCRKFTLEDYSMPGWKESGDTARYQCSEGEDAFSRSTRVSDLLGINGVPAFYIDDGTFISGSEMILLDRALGKK
jgi:thiol:disulfide interchange protein DsbC